jgi:hypothetical protein
MLVNHSLKSASLVLGLLTRVLLPSPPLLGQTAQTARSTRRAQSTYHRRTLDDRVKDLAKTLDLNETQQAGLRTILERQQLEARQIQFDQAHSGNERIGRFRALQEDTILRIRALLNDEQKKKYDPLNHGAHQTNSSQPYVDQWLKNGQHN